jgi:hypothetical protein
VWALGFECRAGFFNRQGTLKVKCSQDVIRQARVLDQIEEFDPGSD